MNDALNYCDNHECNCSSPNADENECWFIYKCKKDELWFPTLDCSNPICSAQYLELLTDIICGIELWLADAEELNSFKENCTEIATYTSQCLMKSHYECNGLNYIVWYPTFKCDGSCNTTYDTYYPGETICGSENNQTEMPAGMMALLIGLAGIISAFLFWAAIIVNI